MHRTPATQHLSFSHNALILLSWNVLLLSSSQGPVNRPFSLNSSLTFPVLCSLQFFWTFTALAICTSLTSGYKLQWSAFCCLTGQPLNQIANFKMKLGPWPLLWICAPYILHEHSSWYQKKKGKTDFAWSTSTLFSLQYEAQSSSLLQRKLEGHKLLNYSRKDPFFPFMTDIAGGQPEERERGSSTLQKLASLSCSKGMLRCSDMPIFKYKCKSLFKNEA